MEPTTATRRPPDDDREPVVVVGARCAGAATALLLARQGHDVLVVDRATFPSDTLSTHAIARGGVVQLARWGLLDAVVESGAPKVRSVLFQLDDGGRRTVTVKDRAGVDFLVAPRRHVLDSIVLNAAIDAGARFESGFTVTGTVADDSGRVVGVRGRDGEGRAREIPASFVVGADGVRSRIARAVGAAVIDERPSDAATQYAYVAGMDGDGFEFHLGPHGFAGIFRTHDDEANVWVCSPADDAITGTDRTAAFMRLLERTAPSLAARVRRGRITSPVRGAVRLPNRVLEAAGPGWALVGDAGYHRDPITGHGITDAFRDAELLARALGRALKGDVPEADALATYARERDRALAPIFDVTTRLASFPPADEFAALQKELSALIETEACWLAALPPLPAADLVAA
jgi:flavin-dependent dehydrogenase